MYTIINYRQNHEIWRGGYLEGGTDSEFELLTTQDRDEAVKALASLVAQDMADQNEELNDRAEFYSEATILVGISGYFGRSYTYDFFESDGLDQAIAKLWEDANILANADFEGRRSRHRERERAKAVEEHRRKTAADEEAERRELSRLLKKYMVSD